MKPRVDELLQELETENDLFENTMKSFATGEKSCNVTDMNNQFKKVKVLLKQLRVIATQTKE